MNLDRVGPGRKIPEEFNVIIEIPANADPVKYELDKETGALFVDRFVMTNMRYPQNYGYIPHTIADDGDPVDVLVITPYPLTHGCVVRCRALGMLNMEDEGGGDAKLLAVPIDKLLPSNKNVKSVEDVDPAILEQIKFFFENYKAMEPGKWVKVAGWDGPEAAIKEITDGIERAKAKASS
ncbi:MAG: inorganic diphosphatase [Lautropia sp.]|nr:inorganic diphosphatase [Lautropia sp.]